MIVDNTNSRKYTIRDARKKVRTLLKVEGIKAVRLIKWEFTPHPSIVDICECPANINGNYTYRSAVESIMKDWCEEGACFSIEPVIK